MNRSYLPNQPSIFWNELQRIRDSQNVRVLKIHSQNTSDVASTIADALHRADPCVLFITHASWQRIQYIPKEMRWHLILDEMPQANFTAQLNFSEHRDELLHAFDVKPFNAFYDECAPNKRTSHILRNEKYDEIWNDHNLREVVARIESKHWIVHCDSSSYQGFKDGTQDTTLFHALFQPSCLIGYKSVGMLGAAMDRSLLYRLWSGSVEFEQHVGFKPRFTQHVNIQRIKIWYLLNRQFSKAVRQKKTKTGNPVIDDMKAGVESFFKGREYLWLGNADIKDNELSGQRLPNMPHGINDDTFTSKTNVAILFALNCPPAHIKYIERTTGISADQLYEAIGLSNCYQAIMRCDPAP